MSGRKCTICNHAESAAITKLLAAGGSKRVVAAQFGLNDSAIQRHRQNCLRLSTKEKIRAAAVEPIVPAGSGRFESLEPKALVAGTARLVDEALSLLEGAKRADDRRTALQALREARDGLALLMKAAGMLGSDNPTINIDNRKLAVALDAKDLEELLALRTALPTTTAALDA